MAYASFLCNRENLNNGYALLIQVRARKYNYHLPVYSQKKYMYSCNMDLLTYTVKVGKRYLIQSSGTESGSLLSDRIVR